MPVVASDTPAPGFELVDAPARAGSRSPTCSRPARPSSCSSPTTARRASSPCAGSRPPGPRRRSSARPIRPRRRAWLTAPASPGRCSASRRPTTRRAPTGSRRCRRRSRSARAARWSARSSAGTRRRSPRSCASTSGPTRRCASPAARPSRRMTPDQLAADAADPGDDPEAMYELGWTDGLPTIAPTPERVAAMLAGRDPRRSLGERAAGHGCGDARAGGGVRRARRLPPRALRDRRGRGRGDAAPRVQPARPGGDDAAGRPDRGRERPGAAHGRA